ncbi:MAG: pyrimidine 5'-nucleotidase [Beijerinckiaceae bacterium]|nr:pyrimidine 5'-nucleotidase [Beijerinckiaceae bacterium]
MDGAASNLSEAFSHVDTWVFDLDNTLYASDSDLWPKIDQRITLYVMQLFGEDGLSARALQKYYYQRYGTTLRGIMEENGVDPAHFLDFAHDIDRSALAADPALSRAIGALPGRKLILTNGSRGHAEATATQLGILHHFEDIFDIVSGDYLPKPEMATYRRFFERHAIEPAKAAMFEDLERNLKPAKESGMRTVLVMPKTGQQDHRDGWEKVVSAPDYIDYATDDLSTFLGRLVPAVTGRAAPV